MRPRPSAHVGRVRLVEVDRVVERVPEQQRISRKGFKVLVDEADQSREAAVTLPERGRRKEDVDGWIDVRLAGAIRGAEEAFLEYAEYALTSEDGGGGSERGGGGRGPDGVDRAGSAMRGRQGVGARSGGGGGISSSQHRPEETAREVCRRLCTWRKQTKWRLPPWRRTRRPRERSSAHRTWPLGLASKVEEGTTTAVTGGLRRRRSHRQRL